MAFGDVLAGMAQASHEHQKTLLSMQHENDVQVAHMLGQMAVDPRFYPAQQQELAKNAIGILTGNVKSKDFFDPKKNTLTLPVELMPGTPQAPQQPQPGALPMGTPGAPLGMQAPQIAPPPAMPAVVEQRGMMQPMSPEEFEQRKLGIQMQTAQTMSDFLSKYGISPQNAALLALGKQIPGVSMVPGEVNGNDLPLDIKNDAYGQPVDRTGNQLYRQEYNKWGQPTGQVFPSTTPPASVQMGAAISPADFAARRAQGEPFLDQNGQPITEIGPNEALFHLRGVGVPPNTYFRGSQRIGTTTADNLVQTRGALNAQPTGVIGTAVPPTTRTQEQIMIDPNTGQVRAVPTVGTSQRQTGTAAAPTPPGTAPVTKQTPAKQAPATTPTAPTKPVAQGGPGRAIPGVLPPGVMQQQRQFVTPIKQSAVQLFGDPTDPNYESLQTFAGLADNADSRKRIGAAARLIIDDLAAAEKGGGIGGQILGSGASFSGGDIWSALKNTTGITNWVAQKQVAATERALGDLRPVERNALNHIMAAYGTIVGLRSLTRGGAYRFSVESMERELPIPGVSVNDSRSYYGKLAILGEEVANGIRNNGISIDVLPERPFYESSAKVLGALSRGEQVARNPQSGQFLILRNGKWVSP